MDLHVHTCLSPCGDNSMVPATIIERAQGAGLQGIAICDHNAAANASAVREAGMEAGIGIIAGMEVSSAEEIHLLALFDSFANLQTFADLVKEHLSGENNPDLFGDQIVVDKSGDPVALETALLIGAADLGIGRIVEEIHGLEGLAIASHVDKQNFSLLSQLGFVPDDLALDAVELSRHAGPLERYPLAKIGNLPLVRCSDAHFPEEIGQAYTTFLVKEVTVSEIALALAGNQGRKILAYEPRVA
ncbi:MAG: PHP domain-containing protein [Spirochaetaceae bacterium]|nr:MAG: PHP domain-containing protein [Spirochaetaceae bacterium]